MVCYGGETGFTDASAQFTHRKSCLPSSCGCDAAAYSTTHEHVVVNTTTTVEMIELCGSSLVYAPDVHHRRSQICVWRRRGAGGEFHRPSLERRGTSGSVQGAHFWSCRECRRVMSNRGPRVDVVFPITARLESSGRFGLSFPSKFGGDCSPSELDLLPKFRDMSR